jgi:serine/threonine protein phosphatase PrpC
LGIFDGHGGVACAEYLTNNLFNIVITILILVYRPTAKD